MKVMMMMMMMMMLMIMMMMMVVVVVEHQLPKTLPTLFEASTERNLQL